MALAEELADRASPDSPYVPPQTTLSVGSIHGGTAHNIVAGECAIQWEMRPVTSGDARYVMDRLREFEHGLVEEMRRVAPDAGLSTVTDGAVGGLEQVHDSPAVSLAAELLGDSLRQVVAFSTEAGLYQAAGIPAVVCGPGSIDVAHQPDEYISLAQLDQCLDLMDRLATKLSSG